MVEQISDLSGLSKSNQSLAIIFSLFMFSLMGIPPFLGFFGKWFAFAPAMDAGMIWLVVFALVASVIGAFYYLRIVKIMVFDEPAGEFDGPMRFEYRTALAVSAALMLAFVIGGLGVPEMAAEAATAFAKK